MLGATKLNNQNKTTMATKVLIVLDGSYRFEKPSEDYNDDFTFTVLVNTLKIAGFDLTRAHRDTIEPNAVDDGKVDVVNFKFQTTGDHNLLNFDVIWIFGYSGRNVQGTTSRDLAADEIGALTNFMDAGGGVFATGDHDSMGANLCGWMPRIRAMRAWFGPGDPNKPPELNGFPPNFPPLDVDRADTVQRNPLGNYDMNQDGVEENHVYFENQSDSIPQPLSPISSPAHPILRRNGMDIMVYPDHMHEGQTFGEKDLEDVATPYDRDLPTGVTGGFVEFPTLDGHRELPEVIATGEGMEFAQIDANTQSVPFNLPLAGVPAEGKTINSLCVYDGRKVGVGRIVTGSTFHHYIDINLKGDSKIPVATDPTDVLEPADLTGPDAAIDQGFNFPGAEETFANIKAVFVNITKWLARTPPKIELILERSTFSMDEVNPVSDFDGAVLVTVDGLKPEHFSGGSIDTLSPTQAQLDAWAPSIAPEESGQGIEITPTSIDSSSPSLPDKVQRFTFTYRLRFINENGFSFIEEYKNLRVNASLSSSATSAALTDSALIQLVKSANPFMLDLDDDDSTSWLSSDVRVFTVVEGQSRFGHTLPDNATKSQAHAYLQNVIGSIDESEFEDLSVIQADSVLSPFPTTSDDKKVYNFAIARVRLNGESASADKVRVFFRIFTSQTTAALTYRHPEGGEPLDGYRRTTSANPIAMPGVNSSGNEWISFPFFGQNRASNPMLQSDGNNVKDMTPSLGEEVSTFFGALLDNNLNEPYLPSSPASASSAQSLSTLLAGEHQCLVAQIEYSGTPIPHGSKPNTSDKLAQRNLAIMEVANPGVGSSRIAFHTFEFEATPGMISAKRLPDELMFEWGNGIPEGTYAKIYVPTWSSSKVLELANDLYVQHDLAADDEQTIIVPGSGTQYIPIPRSLSRQTGVIVLQFPFGIVKGQRFDLVVRQITNRQHRVPLPPGKGTYISREEAVALIRGNLDVPAIQKAKTKKQIAQTWDQLDKVYRLPDNRILYTDTAFINNSKDQSLLYEPVDPKLVATARRREAKWREVIGAFQFGVAVSVKEDMLLYHLRLLSLFRWRLEMLSRNSRWFKTLSYYVDLLTQKVLGLGGAPYTVPATPDGNIGALTDPKETGDNDDNNTGGGDNQGTESDDPYFEPDDDDWLNETEGLPDPKKVKPLMVSGKVSGLLYDHFGDFEGFTLETYGGDHFRFFSQESAILEIVRTAWLERYVVTVITTTKSSRRVRRVLIR